MPSPWIWKGVSATLWSGRYTLSYPRGRIVYTLLFLCRTSLVFADCHSVHRNKKRAYGRPLSHYNNQINDSASVIELARHRGHLGTKNARQNRKMNRPSQAVSIMRRREITCIKVFYCLPVYMRNKTLCDFKINKIYYWNRNNFQIFIKLYVKKSWGITNECEMRFRARILVQVTISEAYDIT